MRPTAASPAPATSVPRCWWATPSGLLANQGACCVDLRLPLFQSPNAAWDKLVYTATIDAEQGPAVLQNEFLLSQDGHFAAVVPEPTQTALLAAGLLAVGFASRRRAR
jgi:hypothetical protein